MNRLLPLWALALLLASPLAAADSDTAVHFDRVVIQPEELHYREDDRNLLTPDRSLIEIVNFRAMSNGSGERFALITVKNKLGGRQILEEEDFVGIFADGKRSFAQKMSISLDASETRSIVLAFGNQQFPLMKVLIDSGS